MSAPGLAALRSRVEAWHERHPPLRTPWQAAGLPGRFAGAALLAVEGALGLAEETGELWLPRPGDREGALFHPGYGLLPDTERVRQACIARTGEGDRFHKMLFVLRTMKSLIERRTRTTKRDIFYENFTEFSSQGELDRLVAEVVALVQVPRLLLGVVATSKGLVVGDLIYMNSEEVTVDCSLAAGGDSIPPDVAELTELRTDAAFVLVVEKDAVFQRLLEEGVLTGELPPFVMVTGKGMPDLASRQLVYRLATEFQLPVLLLTDCDPYGLEIALTYKFGSLAMAWAPERLAVPSSLWLGLLPSDVAKLGIPPESMRPLSVDDRKKVQDLHGREYVRDCCPLLLPELECLWGMGRKAEIQQLAEEREPGFLAHSYLPSKLRYVGARAAGGFEMF